MIGFFLILTVNEPFFMSLENDELGYGIGIGPAGGDGGLMHTSGKSATVLLLLALQEISLPLA